jgi:hypothetical protein
MAKKKSRAKRGNPYSWAKKGSVWKNLLDYIQPTVEGVKPLGAEISRERWDAPELRIQWFSSDKIGRAIQILISDGSGILLSGSAWKDSEQERRWKTQSLGKVSITSGARSLNLSTFSEKLNDVKNIVAGWTEADFDREDSLPPRSCNFKAK